MSDWSFWNFLCCGTRPRDIDSGSQSNEEHKGRKMKIYFDGIRCSDPINKESDSQYENETPVSFNHEQLEITELNNYRVEKYRNLSKEKELIIKILKSQKSIAQDIKHPRLNCIDSEEKYFLIESGWINKWKRERVMHATTIETLPSRTIENFSLITKEKVIHIEDFYLVSSGKMWIEFTKNFKLENTVMYQLPTENDLTPLDLSYDSESHPILYNPGRDSEDKIAKLISMQWIDSTPEFQNKTKAKVDVGGTENIYKRKNIKRKSKQ